MSTTAVARDKSPFERFLGLFTDVRPGEGAALLLMALDVFLIFSAYYTIKPVREAWIISSGGAEVKSYSGAAQAFLLLFLVPAYAALAAKFPRRRLITVVTIFFAACLVAFYLLNLYGLVELRILAVVFFLWIGIFNLMVPAQFWSYANDVYTVDQGKRLFAIIAFGASAGAVVGSFVTGRLIDRLGVSPMLLLAAGILLLSLVPMLLVEARIRRAGSSPAPGPPDPRTEVTARRAADEPVGKSGAFQLVLRNRYLLLIAGLMFLLNWVNTNGEYILTNTLQHVTADLIAAGQAGGRSQGQLIGKFYSDFFGIVNLAGLLIQLFVVSRLIKYIGVSRAILVLPLVALGSYATLAFVPILSVVRWAKTAENSLDYSVQNTVRQALFLPTTREEKYKAKQVIDSFFWRFGDMFSAALVYAGTHWLSYSTSQFALTNLVLVSIWLVLAVLIGREYRRKTGEGAAARRAVAEVVPA